MIEHSLSEKRERRPRLTPRDLEVLRCIGEQYCLRFDQLRRVLALWSPASAAMRESGVLSEEVTRRILRRWKTEELVASRLFLYHEPAWIWLTRKGLQYVGLDVRYYEPKPSELHHLYYINQARFYVQQRRQEDHWVSERLLRSQQERLVRGMITEHRPDGLLVKPNGDRIAIEVELHAKAKLRYVSILQDLQPRYHRVWYFAPATVVKVLQEMLVQALTEEQRKTVQIVPLEERL